MPRDKGVVLGLISSKVAELEPRAQIIQRIEDASRYVPLDNLALSPQCGFASSLEGNLLTEDEQWRKMQLLGTGLEQPTEELPTSVGGLDSIDDAARRVAWIHRAERALLPSTRRGSRQAPARCAASGARAT